MTENEAIKEFNKMIGVRMKTQRGISQKQHELFQIAMYSLEEIQQYRAIGTVDECREARERQRVKKYRVIKPCKSVTYYQCPFCDGLLHINENFCGECGQAISWECDNE